MHAPDDQFCPVCKMENLPSSRECAFCAALLPSQAAGFSTTLEVSETPTQMDPHWEGIPVHFEPADQIVLWVEGFPDSLTIGDEGAFFLGRNLEKIQGQQGEIIIDLSVYDAYEKGVSRRHVLIRQAQKTYEIADLDSTNGTWVNQRRLIPDRFYPLEGDNEIRLGHLVMRLFIPMQRAG